MANDIKTEKHGAALVISFNRPDRGNAMTLELANQLFLTVKNATVDKGVRAILLCGEGADFMAGMDFYMYAQSDFTKGVERNNEMLLPYHQTIRELQVMEKPVLAVVSGQVSGPGFSLMLACDLVLAGQNTKISAGFASYAMSPDGGMTHFLTRKVGAAKATEILMLNETMDAAKAEKLGLVNGVVEDAKLQEEALQWVDRLANGPTKAFGGIKRLIAKAYEQDLNSQLALEHVHWGACSRSFDFRDAIKAHFAKRPTKYSGA